MKPLRKNPDDALAHNNLGCTYYESGKYKKAIEACKQSIRINPDYANAHFNLGLAYIMLNDRSSALDQYTILKTLDSEQANDLFDYINE